MSETFPVTLSTGRNVELRELNGLEQVRADMCVPDEASSSVSVYFRVAMSITKIDGNALPAASSQPQLESRMAQLRGTELDELVREYYRGIRERITSLPKESAPADEQPNSSS